MFIIENNKITSEKMVEILEVKHPVTLDFKFSEAENLEDEKFKLIIDDIEANKYMTDDNTVSFRYIDLSEKLKKQNQELSIKILQGDNIILDDTITFSLIGDIPESGGDGEEIEGILLNTFPIKNATEIAFYPDDLLQGKTDLSYFFQGCSGLKTIPELDTSAATNVSYIFSNCNSLESVPLFDTSKVTIFTQMFQNCKKLKSVPLFDTSSGIVFSNMFQACYQLESVPVFNTSKGTNFSSMFTNCQGIKTIPAIDTSNGTSFDFMFFQNYSIETIPAIDTSKGTNFRNMFENAKNIKTIPAIDTSKGTNFSNMFKGCLMLETISGLDLTSGTNFSNMFQNCSNLQNLTMTGIKVNLDISPCKLLTHESLINVLNGLFDLTGSNQKTLTLGSTNLAKLTDDEKAIATNKNWILA